MLWNYAYGLKIAALSSKAYLAPQNNYQYQGDYAEFDDDLGWHDFALRSYDPQIGRFLQNDPYDEFASGYVGMGNDPANLTDEDGGCTGCTALGGSTGVDVVVTASKRLAQTGSSATKVLSTASTGLKVVQQTYHIYQNSSGEQFETTNPGLGSSTSHNGQGWDHVGSHKENLYEIDDELPSHFSGDRWQERLKYYYDATKKAAKGEDPWDLAERNWNNAHSVQIANRKITRDGFWTGGEETISVSPTAIEPTDGPEALIGIGGKATLKGGLYVIVKFGAREGASSIFSHITRKIAKQLGIRGWTTELIHGTVNSPFTTRAALNRATGNAATAFFTKEGGYVVRDNITGHIIQVSNRLDPKWIPDATIINPYIPK